MGTPSSTVYDIPSAHHTQQLQTHIFTLPSGNGGAGEKYSNKLLCDEKRKKLDGGRLKNKAKGIGSFS